MNNKICIKAFKTEKYQPKEGDFFWFFKVLKKIFDRPMFWHLPKGQYNIFFF